MNFPTSFDVFVNPAAADSMDSPAVYHDVQHANINDAVTALQAKIGIDGSAVATSLDYLVKNVASVDPGHIHTGFSLPVGGDFTLVFTGTPVTVNGTNYHVGFGVQRLDIDIAAGVTDSGSRWGARILAYADAGLKGTLAELYALQFSYGTYTGVPVAGTITNCYGIHVNAFCFAGNITNLYGIYIRQPYTGGTLTNEWGIYQVSTTAKNYFGGKVGIGQAPTTYALEVAGTIQATGYRSADGTAGLAGTTTKTAITSITVRDGLVTALAGT